MVLVQSTKPKHELLYRSESISPVLSGSTTGEMSSLPPTEKTPLLRPEMRFTLSRFREAISGRSVALDILAIFFGISSWIGINSAYVELPLLVNNTPESWNLPSYMVLIIQVANIGPILYTLLQKWRVTKDSYFIYFVLVVGTVASILFAFLYQRTAVIFGSERSVALLTFVFCFALVGCTSSVLFMPYMGRFREIYLITYLIGEGLSGFLPAGVALIQGVGGNAECRQTENGVEPYYRPPKFSVQEFYYFVFALFVTSSIAFLLIDRLKVFRNEYAAVQIREGNDYEYDEKKEIEQGEVFKKLSKGNYAFLMVLMGIVCMFSNGVFPSVQSYSCLPYGNVAYHLTVTLSAIANPVACFLAVFLPHTSIRAISSLSVCTAIFAIYALTTSSMSPSPPLQNNAAGVAIIVICWTILTGLHSYVRLSINTVFRQQGGKSLVWIGATQQLGSCIGSIISFVLINFTNIFGQYDPCENFIE